MVIGDKALIGNKGEYASLALNGEFRTADVITITTPTGVIRTPKVLKVVNPSYNNKLPSGYTLVEYLESTGTQLITTNVTSRYEITADLDIAITKYQNGLIFGTSWTSAALLLHSLATTNLVAYWGATAASLPFEAKKRLDIKIRPNQYILNGTSYATSGNITSFGNILLFGVTSYFAGVRYYGCKIYDTNVLIRDYIPCIRNSDSVAGLYDLVENKFYVNTGTGTFVTGSIVTQYITQYSLLNLSKFGTYTITASREGYPTETTSVVISDTKTYSVDIKFGNRYDLSYVKTEVYSCGSSRGTSFNVLKCDSYLYEKTPVHTGLRPTANMSTNWSGNEPWGSPTDYYFVWYTFWCHCPTAYTKTTTMTSDDQGTVYLNDVLIAYRNTSMNLNFKAGWNKLEMIYWEETGGSYACFSGWDPSTDVNFDYVGPYPPILEEDRITTIWT